VSISSDSLAGSLHAEPWTGPAVRMLAQTAFHSRGRIPVTNQLLLAAITGVSLALFARSLPPVATAIALAASAGLIVVWRVTGRWAWPWQRAHVGIGAYQQRHLRGILGGRVGRDAAEAWLLQSTDAPIRDRHAVLTWLGRSEEAEGLIAEFPVATPGDRSRRAWVEAGQRWRIEGRLDVSAVTATLAALDDAERLRAAAHVAYWSGVADIAAGGDLRSAPPPGDPGLSVVEVARLWRFRLWPVEWLLGGFLVASLVLTGIRLLFAN
jgi:hypothetical protein